MAGSLLPLVIPALLVLYAARRLYQKTPNFPPSPPGDPILGHALRIPQTEAWKTFARWGKLYGPVIFARVFGRSMIIVNSFKAARDLMDKKSANFSDRPSMVVFDIIGVGVILPCLPYGTAQFRKQRRLMQQYLGSLAISSYDHIQEERVRKLLHQLIITPDEFYHHIHGHVASVVVKTVYDHDICGDPASDPLIRMTEQAARLTTETGNIGATVIDLFPFLRHVPAWFPGMGVKRKALEAGDVLKVVFLSPFEEAKMKKAAGDASSSVVYQLLDEYEDLNEISREDEDDLKNFAGTFYNAGTDTTRSALQMFFLMMVLNPEVQRRAQNDIERTIGLDRLPVLSDRANLPYIETVLKEVLRIHPPGPLGVPHQSTSADEYCGWSIPARSLIIPNIWQMMRDEEVFPDPLKFVPDRHAVREGQKGVFDSVADDPVSAVFGFGRRACPGRAFAESMMWITMANILAAFDISPCKDPVTGEEVLPIVEFQNDIVNSVKPFQCSIVPRKENLAQLVRDG